MKHATHQVFLALVVVLVGSALIAIARRFDVPELALIGGWVVGWLGFRRPGDARPPDPPPDDPPKPKHKTHWAIVFAVFAFNVGCGSVPSGNAEVDEYVGAICEEERALCVPTSAKEDLGFDEYADSVYWGRYSYGEIEVPDVRLLFPGGNLTMDDIMARIGIACFEDDKCAEDLPTCGGVVMHEIGHQYEGSDQTDADCWAARNGEPEHVAALIDLVCSFYPEEGDSRGPDGKTRRCRDLEACAP